MLQKNDTTLPYHAFGMEMPGRKWTASNYRYSHNGHEKEEEIFAGANSAEFWMYDSRIGRRWELDPIQREYESPYACFSNNPIYFSDLLGLAPGDPKGKSGGGDKGKTSGKKSERASSGETITKNPDGSTSSTVIFDDGGKCTVNTPAPNTQPQSVPTNGPLKGNPPADPNAPGGWTGDGYRIVAEPKSRADIMRNHNFNPQFFATIGIVSFDQRKMDYNIFLSKSLKVKSKTVTPGIGFNKDGFSGIGVNDFSVNKEMNEWDISGWAGYTKTINQFAFISKQNVQLTVPNLDNTGVVKLSVNTSTTIMSYSLRQFYVGFVCHNHLRVTSRTFFDAYPYGKFSMYNPNFFADTTYFNENVSGQIKFPGTSMGGGLGWR
ncbi:MAG: hypothetical protein ACK5QC_03365 [Bacteroidota bacterium]